MFPSRRSRCPICDCSLEQAKFVDEEKGLSERFASEDSYWTHCQNLHPDFLVWERSKTKTMLLLGVATAIPVTVAVFWFFLAFAPWIFSGRRNPILFLPILAFFIPAYLFVRLGTRKYRREWEARGSLPIRATSPIPLPIESSYENEDQGILAVVSALPDKLRFISNNPRKVAWQTMIQQGRGFLTVPSDGCLFLGDTVYFAENMKGRLSPDEWKPIIASVLIFPTLKRELATRLLLILLPILAAYITAWFFIPPLFPTITHYSPQGQPVSFSNDGWIVMIIVGFAIMFLSIAIGIINVGKVRLLADTKAAEIFGTEVFINSLNKLREASPSDTLGIEKRLRNLSISPR